MAFYSSMARMAADLLRPDTAGGLGQGAVILTRFVPGTPDPATPWEPVTPTTESETLKAAVSGVGQEYIDGVTILAGDLKVIAAVPSMNWRLAGNDNATLSISIDGRPHGVIRTQGIPEAGTTAAVEFIIRA